MSMCVRYRLDVPKLWLDFFKENSLLNPRERALMKETLREPEIERILRDRRPRKALSLLVHLSDLTLLLETSKEDMEGDIRTICMILERGSAETLDSLPRLIEPRRGDAHWLMNRFLEVLSRSKAEFD